MTLDAWNELFGHVDRIAKHPWPLRIRMNSRTFLRTREALVETDSAFPESVRWNLDDWLEWNTAGLFSIPVVVDGSVIDGEIEVDLPFGLTVPY